MKNLGKKISKIKKTLFMSPFQDDLEHARHKSSNVQNNKDILIHNIPYLFTCNEEEKLTCNESQSIVISKGVIQEVIPAKKAKTKNFSMVYEAGMRGGIVVTPGLINAHAHPPMYLMRSAMMLDEGESVDETIASMPKWERSMTDEDYAISSIGDITEQQKAGITTTLSHFAVHWPLEIAAQITGQNIINAVSVASNTHPENSPALIRELLKERGVSCKSKLAVALHYVHKGNDQIFREIGNLTKQHNLLFTCHMAESKAVARKCEKIHKKREVDLLEKYGLLNEKTILSHSIHVKENEINKLIKNRVGIVHLPTSNVIHKSGTFPLWKFRDLGGGQFISLGTDGVVSKSRLDLLSEAYQTRITHLYDRTVKFGSLFKMMTVNAARVLNMPERGSVLPGKKADLAFWKLRDRGFIPYDKKNPMTLLGNLITHGGRSVRDVMINGEFIVKSRRHTKINETKLLAVLQNKHMEMRKRLSAGNG